MGAAMVSFRSFAMTVTGVSWKISAACRFNGLKSPIRNFVYKGR